jgi:hypothetical protein
MREYAEWSNDSSLGVNIHSGIIAAKRALNKFHFEIGLAGFNQVSMIKYFYFIVNRRVV